MAALQYVHIPGYSALLLRRTFPQLTKADSLIPRSTEWLINQPGVTWSEKGHKWTFPSGATIEFGHLQYENDKYNYQGAAYQFIGWDELTQFNLTQYQYLFSRARRPDAAARELSQVPIRIRSGSNPGGVGHEWVKRRFIGPNTDTRLFLPAKLGDNPHVDRKEYEATLSELDPVTRRHLLDGDWTARNSGGFFKREWVDFCDAPPNDARSFRAWDFAATKERPGTDPDWTAGARVWEKNRHWWVGPVLRNRYSPNGLDKAVLSTANMDGHGCKIRIEQEPGSAGKIALAHFVKLLAGFDVRGRTATGAKLSRFGPFASQCEAGNVTFVNGPWVSDCIEELEALQADDSHAHDDQADAIALGFNEMSQNRAGWSDAIAMMGAAA
jgi:predicted phage terminase large subunit-like protein